MDTLLLTPGLLTRCPQWPGLGWGWRQEPKNSTALFPVGSRNPNTGVTGCLQVQSVALNLSFPLWATVLVTASLNTHSQKLMLFEYSCGNSTQVWIDLYRVQNHSNITPDFFHPSCYRCQWFVPVYCWSVFHRVNEPQPWYSFTCFLKTSRFWRLYVSCSNIHAGFCERVSPRRALAGRCKCVFNSQASRK